MEPWTRTQMLTQPLHKTLHRNEGKKPEKRDRGVEKRQCISQETNIGPQCATMLGY